MPRSQRILADLNELGRIEPDAALTRHAIERAKIVVKESFIARTAFTGRGRKLSLVRSLMAIAAVAIVMYCVAQWMPSGSNGNIAFAQVQAQIAKTKTVQYVETITSMAGDDKVGSEQVRRVAILDGQLKREEVTDKLGDYWAPKKGKNKVDPCVTIYDLKAPKTLLLYPEKKGYVARGGVVQVIRDDTVFDIIVIGHKLPPEWKAKEVTPDSNYSLYNQIRELPTDKAKSLPGQMIDGKKATGFVIDGKREEQGYSVNWQQTYWVDPNTKLPLRIEYSIRCLLPDGKIAGEGKIDGLIKDIVFDAPLDPKLFSTVPPEGWTDLAAQKPAAADNSNGK
jgi:outer membrane lipoprotein-sorting protein